MRLGISEILDRADSLRKKQDKVDVLQKNGFHPHNQVLFDLLKLGFENAEWDLEPGLVEYKPCQFHDMQSSLYQSFKMIERHFLKDANPQLTPEGRTTLYIQFLESLDKDDAALVEGIRNKIIPYETITRELIDTAFPGLITVKQSVAPKKK